MSHFLALALVDTKKLDDFSMHDTMEPTKALKFENIFANAVVSVEKDSSLSAEQKRAALEEIDQARNLALREVALRHVLANMMAPYDENVRVDPYEERCDCVGSQAQKEAIEAAAAAAGGDLRALRDAFGAREDVKALRKDYFKMFRGANDPDPTPEEEATAVAAEEEIGRLWGEYVATYVATEKSTLAAHPLRNTPNPDCEDCNGTGKSKSTYNPKSKWDWYRIGGRWDGFLKGPEVEKERSKMGQGFNFGDEHSTPELNTMSGAELPEEITDNFVPFAIITPDGQWNERGKMGWWGIVNDEMDRDDWKAKAKKLLGEFRDERYLVVALDCHI